MKSIHNKSHRALVVPLPQGKKLHLGPGQTGQISVHAVDHPPLLELVEAGDVEILDDRDPRHEHASRGAHVHSSTHGHPWDKKAGRRGDR